MLPGARKPRLLWGPQFASNVQAATAPPEQLHSSSFPRHSIGGRRSSPTDPPLIEMFRQLFCEPWLLAGQVLSLYRIFRHIIKLDLLGAVDRDDEFPISFPYPAMRQTQRWLIYVNCGMEIELTKNCFSLWP